MRVLHVIKITGLAGAENHLLALLEGLKQRGIDVSYLLLIEPHNPVDDFVKAASARVISGERVVIRHHADLTLLPRLWRALRRLKPDIVHTHLLHADLYGIPAARLAGVGAVVSSRHAEDDFRRRTLIKIVNRLLWQMTDAGINISDAVKRFSIEVEGAPLDRMHTVYYGFDPQGDHLSKAEIRRELSLGHDDLVAGIVCRLIELKGVTYAIQAMARLKDEVPNAKLLIMGDGPIRAALEAEANELNVSDRVLFLGWRSDAALLMAALDVLVVTSLREGFGLVMLEAMAQSVPVIGSAVSALPEVIADDVTGKLFPARDVDALANAMLELFNDPAKRELMGQAGHKRLEENFSIARMIDRTIEVYERVQQEN